MKIPEKIEITRRELIGIIFFILLLFFFSWREFNGNSNRNSSGWDPGGFYDEPYPQE